MAFTAHASATALPATIKTNMTLTAAGGPYTGSPIISPGVTVRIQPGARLTLGKFVVSGTLKAEGTAAEPIVFTGAEEEAAGEWEEIRFEPSSGSSSVLDHVMVKYGGGAAGVGREIRCNGSSPTIERSTFSHGADDGISVGNGGSPHIVENAFVGAQRDAISEITEGTSKIDIHDNVIEGGRNGIFVEVAKEAIDEHLSGNTIIGTEGEALTIKGAMLPPDVSRNTLEGNKEDVVTIIRNLVIQRSETIEAGPTPLRTEAGGWVYINAGYTVAIEPGTVWVEPELIVNGTLKAEGTAAEPIVFTGAEEEAAGEWKGIELASGSDASVLDHVVIAYGGEGTKQEIRCYKSAPTIENSTLSHSTWDGILAEGGSSPHIRGDRFVGMGHDAIEEITEGTSKIDIHDNVIEGGRNGIFVESNAKAVSESLSGNTIIGTEGEALVFNGSQVPPGITENTLLSNHENVITLRTATVSQSQTWKSGGTPILIAGSALSVPTGVTLTIEPGVVLLEPSMSIAGTLIAEGTDEEPVEFTGVKEEKAGEWSQIVFKAGSGESVLDHARVSYGGSGMLEMKGSHPRITNSTLRAASGYAIKAVESGQPTVENDRFRQDTAGGVSYSGTSGTKLSARNNDWNCATGPYPAGCGAKITGNVEWKPAAILPELSGHCRGKESQCGEGADPVSLATGALDYSHTDLSLPSKGGEPLTFMRTYASDSSADAGLGAGWSQAGLSTATELPSGEVLVVRPDGRQDVFSDPGTGYVAPSGVTDALEKVEGTFRLATLGGIVYRFDTSGRIESATDAHGLVATWAYNSEGRLSTITDPSGQSLTFAYDASNHITSVKDSTGREVKFGYSASRELETVTDPLGGVTKYGYEGTRLKTVTDARGNVILRNIYDAQGRISEQVDGVGATWTMAYQHGQTTVIEPDGGEKVYDFDSQDRVVSETDALGHTTTIAYDSRGQVESVDRPGGADWHLGHDAAGNLTSVADPEDGESTWAYEARNHPTRYTDSDGHTWHYEWSAAGNLEKQTDPEGGETLYEYDAFGDPIAVTDPDGQESKFGYNALGERTSLKDPLGHEWTWAYDARGFGTLSTEPGLKAEKLERDALGDLLSRATPEGHKTSYEYDVDGLLVKTTEPGGEIWRIERDAMERPVAYVDPLGHESTVTWNGDLKPATVTNRDGAVTHYRYDAADQLTEREGPEGETWGYGYGPRGERTSLTDPRGHATTYEYDLVGRLTKAEASVGSVAEYAYDPAGRLSSWTDPDGNGTELNYNERGLLTTVKRPLGQTTAYGYDAAGEPTGQITAEASLEYAHDGAGRLTGISDEGEALRSFSYEPNGRPSSAVVAGGPAITLAWTEDGLLSSLDDGRGQTVGREYDSRGELTKLTDGAGAVEYANDALGRMESLSDPQGHTTHFAYSPEGNITGIERPGAIDTTNAYDEASRLAESTTAAGEVTLESLVYGYDADGDPTAVTDRSGEETSYAYDALDRLTEWNPPGAGSTTYSYDPAGNRTRAGATTYSFNALDELTEDSNGTKYSYDGDGRPTAVEGEAGTTHYAWDPLDELTDVEAPGGSSSLTYDALGRLAGRSSGEATRSLHYGDLGENPALATEGEASEGLVYGPVGLLTETTEGEAAAWPLLDGHGSVVATTVGSGEVTSRSSYGPWGEALEGEAELGYLGGYGRPTDPATGIVQMGARLYDPALGAFLSQDPVLGHTVDPMTLDPYPYVLDDPLGRYDLEGRDACVPTPFGDACAEAAAEKAGNAIGGAVEGAAGVAAHIWEREWGNDERNAGFAAGAATGAATVATRTWENGLRSDEEDFERAQEFVKAVKAPAQKVYELAGEHWEGCSAGAAAGAPIGGAAGAPVFGVGAVPGAIGGGVAGCGAVVGTEVLVEAGL